MIFVTVGTHEQPFDRLIKCIDNMKKNGEIQEDIIIQTGFSTYQPRYCVWNNLIPYEQMKKFVTNAHIVITHGGPASFIMPLQLGKIPIVIPRQVCFHEHVNNHQVEFVQKVADRMGMIIPVFDIKKLNKVILNYEAIIGSMDSKIHSNNEKFNREFNAIVNELIK